MPKTGEYNFIDEDGEGRSVKGDSLWVQPADDLFVVAEKSKKLGRALYWATELKPRDYFNLTKRILDIRRGYYVITNIGGPDRELSMWWAGSYKDLEAISFVDESGAVSATWERTPGSENGFEAGIATERRHIRNDQMFELMKRSGTDLIRHSMPAIVRRVDPFLAAN